jgi:hypothetical protein
LIIVTRETRCYVSAFLTRTNAFQALYAVAIITDNFKS